MCVVKEIPKAPVEHGMDGTTAGNANPPSAKCGVKAGRGGLTLGQMPKIVWRAVSSAGTSRLRAAARWLLREELEQMKTELQVEMKCSIEEAVDTLSSEIESAVSREIEGYDFKELISEKVGKELANHDFTDEFDTKEFSEAVIQTLKDSL
jgi:DNA polymerase III alpha subunit (gram-positive type)